MRNGAPTVKHISEPNLESVGESSTIEEVAAALNAIDARLIRMRKFIDRHFGSDIFSSVTWDISEKRRAEEKGRTHKNERDEPEYLACYKFYTEKMLPLRKHASTLRDILSKKYKEKRIAERQQAEAEEQKQVTERAAQMQGDIQDALIAIYEQLPKEAYETGMKEVVAAKTYLGEWEAARAKTLETLLEKLGHASSLHELDKLKQWHKYDVPAWTS